jgi:transketolase
MTVSQQLQERAINTLRFLSVDGVQQANSGHPGLPMGTAAIAYTIWTRHLRHNPSNPKWFNRDRFVLSGGHGSMLLYSLLHLTGYALSLDDLKHFRQWGSLTPGHPEAGHTPGVETTTGPLGQGFCNGVGFAIAEAHLAAEFNQPDFNAIDHYTYAITTDGDLMEGVTSEAASLAGHLQLGKLIYCYDDNRITIDGSTDLAFTEDRGKRFEAYGWQVLYVADGNDVEEIDQAIIKAKADPRPSLIICRTHIGYGLPTRQDTSKAHGEPPGDEELNGAKDKLGWPKEPRFYIPEDVLTHFREAVTTGAAQEKSWNDMCAAYSKNNPELVVELKRRSSGELPQDWDDGLPDFPTDPKGMATRAASGKVLNAIAKKLPELLGGSADLAPSNNTWLQDLKAFQKDSPEGRNFHFGVREHGMASIVNGMALHGGIRPYGATFLVFSDYMRGALRISALSHIPSIWVFTHDSIGLGEDGPTHQPVEHLLSLRAIPGLVTIRPGDANETVAAWHAAINRTEGPTALILSRQAMGTIDRQIYSLAENAERGAYILADVGKGKPDVILMATGSEVGLILEAGEILAKNKINVRLVSFPSWELFREQPAEYRKSVFPENIKARVSIEAGVTMGWREWVGDEGIILGLDHYGASAPAKELYKQFGLTVEKVVEAAESLVAKK